MKDTTYNGWTNYETWVVNLWMDNEQGAQDYWRDTAAEIYQQQQTARPAFKSETHQERAYRVMADVLKDTHEENLPELEGFAADLLNAAMSEVNWYEIAEHLIDAVVEDAA